MTISPFYCYPGLTDALNSKQEGVNVSTSNFQEQVRNFVNQNKLEADVPIRLLDLVAELGETAKEYLKGSDYGKKKFTAAEGWAEELGDLFFSLSCIANQTNVDLSLALTEA